MCKTIITTLLLVLIAIVPCGCERVPTADHVEPVLVNTDHDYICVVAIDLSGSFMPHMTDGKAYDFLMMLLKRYFDSHAGSNDLIVIAQLSGTKRSLLWEGTPHELRNDFPTAQKFREFLLQKADPHGSVIHEGLKHVVDYVNSEPRVANGKAHSGIFVLSDMDDNAPNRDQTLNDLQTSLAAYAKPTNVIGMYYVDQFAVAGWRQRLSQAGFRDCCVYPEFKGTPPFPNLER